MPYALSIAVLIILGIFTWIYRRISFYKKATEGAWKDLYEDLELRQCILEIRNTNEYDEQLASIAINSDEITISKTQLKNKETLKSINEYNFLAQKYNRLAFQFPGNILSSLGSHEQKTLIDLK
jgi:hypothetical protein